MLLTVLTAAHTVSAPARLQHIAPSMTTTSSSVHRDEEPSKLKRNRTVRTTAVSTARAARGMGRRVVTRLTAASTAATSRATATLGNGTVVPWGGEYRRNWISVKTTAHHRAWRTSAGMRSAPAVSRGAAGGGGAGVGAAADEADGAGRSAGRSRHTSTSTDVSVSNVVFST
jgi:hypothetical protein